MRLLRHFLVSAVLIIFLDLASSKTVHYHLVAEYFEAAPDGVSRTVKGFNRQLPGPTVRAAKGDWLVIKVTNLLKLGESTTVHWHGYEHYMNPWQDGVFMITQCGIPYNHSYTYEFRAVQSGTYWYHSHHTDQYGDGLWGVMIIDNTPEVYEYDGEFVLASNVWFHLPSEQLTTWYMNGSQSRGELPYPDTVLINGKGYYSCSYAKLKNVTCTPEFGTRYQVIEVERGKTYRFRFIEASVITSKIVSIDGHKLETIETDGVDTVRVQGVDQAHCATATRHSFLVKMDGDQDQYWIRVNTSLIPYRMKYPNINPIPEGFNITAVAILRYKNVTKSHLLSNPTSRIIGVQGRQERRNTSTSRSWLSDVLWDLKHVEGVSYYSEDPMRLPIVTIGPFPSSNPVINNATELEVMDCAPFGVETAPNYVNETILVSIPNMEDPDTTAKIGFNNISYDASKLRKPALLGMILGERLPIAINPIHINGFGDDYVVEVIINDYGYTGHPIHLHGHTYWIMGFGTPGSGPFNETTDRPKLKSGARRETTSVRTQSWLVIRFRANNPGVWLLHCHMNFHSKAGLALTFVEGQSIAAKVFKNLPKSTVDLCQASGIVLASGGQTSSSQLLTLILLLVVAFNMSCSAS